MARCVRTSTMSLLQLALDLFLEAHVKSPLPLPLSLLPPPLLQPSLLPLRMKPGISNEGALAWVKLPLPPPPPLLLLSPPLLLLLPPLPLAGPPPLP